MALFKILSNMTNPSKSMPNEYHQGYCYFDKNTGRFWIDTTDTKEGRLQINSSFFGECKKLLDSTTGQYTISQANSQVKKVDCDGFVLTPGASIFIKFTETNTYLVSDLSLNVNNTGARVIKYRNADTTRAWMKEGYTYCFVYDGNCYQLVGDLDTTYSGMSIEEGKTGTNTTNRVISAATLKAIIDARGYTTNTGTVTQVSTGVGLTGGPITNSGTIKAKLRSETALTRDSVAATETANRVYPVVQDKSGYLAVNVPWTDNDHNTTYTLTQDASDGHKLTFTPSGGTAVTITIPDNNTTYTTAKYNYLGLMKPAYSSTGAVSLTTTAASNSDTPTISARTTTAQRYYAIEVDKNGIPFVNVPWVDNNTWRGIQNNLTSSSTTDSLSAAMGKKLNDEKVAKAGDTMSGNLTVQKSTAEDTGFLINNTNKTQNLGFIVGSSGNAGLYSYTKGKWITYIDSAGNVQLNGNANTANKASAANITTTQNAIAKYSNTTGTFANSGVLIDNNNNLGVPGNITATGELNLTGNAYLHNETQADSLTAGSLLVTGNANFTQIPTAPTATAGTSNTQLATTEFVTGAVQTVVGPMRFMGSLGGSGATITSLPTASSSNKGYTYKVIKNGTYGTITAKAGDTVISTGSDWVLIPSGDEPSGTVTSITPGNGLLNGTTTNPITTSGTLNINYGTTTAKVGTTATPGSATTVSRSDHIHAIDLATGDSNGQVKIAGTNVNVKGLGSAAYTNSTLYPQISSYTLPATKGVRITYPTHVPVLISAQRSNGGGRLILIGGGYGAEGTVRNDFQELVSPTETCFTWSLPNSTSISCAIEIMNNYSSGDATIMVWTYGAATFTAITALTTEKMNAVLLNSRNYTDYTVTKTGSGASGTWGISISGNAATATTATTANKLNYAAQLTTQAAIDDFLEASKFQVSTFKTTEDNNISMRSNDGMIISLPWTSTGYGAQIALDDNTDGVIKFRGKAYSSWGDWRTILHDGNYTNYTVTKTGTGASGTWGINITGSSGSCTGNAATATTATKDSSGAVIKDTYVKKAGDTMTGNLGIKIGDTDKHIIFDYDGDGTAGASWRIAALGSGSVDTNYFTIQSGTSSVSATDWNNVIRLGQNTFDAGFGGNVYPLVNNTKTLGTSSLKWANVYATTFTGALSGNAATATKFASAQSVALTGDVTGTASSQAGWSIATTLANSGVTANTYGNTSQQTPAHGGTFNIPYFKVDAKGRITQAGTTTVKLPADSNTDTKNTAGSTDTSSKIFLIGATSQATSPQTYSDNQVYATNGQLDANKVRVAEAVSLVYDATLQALNFVFA